MPAAAGLQKADQNALRLGCSGRAISTPYLARHHHRPEGLLGSPVRGLQAGTVQEGEQSVALPQKMIGQASIPARSGSNVASSDRAWLPIVPGPRLRPGR